MEAGESGGVVPRALPRRLVWRLWFGGQFTQFAWAWTAVAIAGVLVVACLPLFLAAYDRTALATIDRIERTGDRYHVQYTFRDEHGRQQSGAARAEHGSFGTSYDVEYMAADPSRSRLAGTGLDLPWWIALVMALFLLPGLAFAMAMLVRGVRRTRLLRDGLPARGRRLHTRETNLVVNDVLMMAVKFEYTVGGRTYRTTVKTLRREALEDDREEQLLHDPRDPSRAALLDDLPGSVRLTADGMLASSPGFTAHLLVAPLASAVLLVAVLAASVLRLA